MRGCDFLSGIVNTALVCALIFVNGATDASSSISGAVASGSLSYRRACVLCAVFNFLGLCLSFAFFPAVARTVSDISPSESTVPVLTVVIFASAAWVFGIPTSESHALLAAMGGVSLYRLGVPDGKFIDICIKSFASCAVGFAAGFIVTYLTYSLLSHRRRVRRNFQILGAALSSACHGIQDGQKFVCLLAPATMSASLPMWAVLLCASVMAFGCLAGGRRITETVGCGIVKGDTAVLNASSDIGAVICTLATSVSGIPISTTYMKTCSLLGAAAVRKVSVVRPAVIRLFAAWVMTYPACMAMSYLLCRVIENII